MMRMKRMKRMKKNQRVKMKQGMIMPLIIFINHLLLQVGAKYLMLNSKNLTLNKS